MYSPIWASTMFRYTSDRYHRSKGLKVKHVLQIAMITVVVTWVIYQLNQSQKPDDKALEKDPPFGRKALKPGVDLMDSEDREKEEPAETKVIARNSTKTNQGHSAAEGEDESDDQREIDTSVENANNDQGGRQSTSHFVGIDKQHEDEGQQQEDVDLHNDVGIDFAELKNEQERVEREESAQEGKDNDHEQDEDPQSQSNSKAEDNTGAEVTLGIDNHLESNEDEDTTTEESKRSSTLKALAADFLPKPNSDIATGNSSEVTEDNMREALPDSSSEPQKERSVESLAEVAEEGDATHESQERSQEKINSQPQESSQAQVTEGTPKPQEFTDKQSPGQPDVSGKSTEKKVDSQTKEKAEVKEEKSEEKLAEQSQNQVEVNVGGKESQGTDEVKLNDPKVEQESKKGVHQEPEKQVLEENVVSDPQHVKEDQEMSDDRKAEQEDKNSVQQETTKSSESGNSEETMSSDLTRERMAIEQNIRNSQGLVQGTETSTLQQGEDPLMKEEKVEKGETQEGVVAQGKVEKLGTYPGEKQEQASNNDNNNSDERKKEPESNSEVQSSETTVLINSSSGMSGSLQYPKTEDLGSLTDATTSSPGKDNTEVVEESGQNKLNKDSGNLPQTEDNSK